jgi:hypothetical protein
VGCAGSCGLGGGLLAGNCNCCFVEVIEIVVGEIVELLVVCWVPKGEPHQPCGH